MRACFANGARMVVGTTGWYDKLAEMQAMCERRNAALLYGANFSVGMQIMYRLVRELVPLARGFTINIAETHHEGKKDAPSGTALAIKQVVLELDPTLKVEIVSHREGEAVGTHILTASKGHDRIEIRHDALSRRSFAEGAVRGAEWLAGKQGCYDFKQIYPQLQ
jgi:4-hydroxy-tetrahydrodipicolinate reductase